MDEEYGQFPSEWEKISDKPLEYRKKVGHFEIVARVDEIRAVLV
jgi:DNA-dependent RNA polymerase auxiliary subunit epsilon